MKYKKILIFLIICIIISSCALITFSILSRETESVSNETILKKEISDTENIHEDNDKEDINQVSVKQDRNTLQVNDTEEGSEAQQSDKITRKKTISNTIKSDEIHSEEDSQVNQESKKNKDQIAIDLTKNEWGEDDSVYYTIDRSLGNKYNICVRSKATTGTLAEYEVDIGKKTVEIK